MINNTEDLSADFFDWLEGYFDISQKFDSIKYPAFKEIFKRRMTVMVDEYIEGQKA
jgi:hypothetical protein